jgi:hypothetical protein
MCPPSYSVDQVTGTVTTVGLAEKHQNFGVRLTSE